MAIEQTKKAALKARAKIARRMNALRDGSTRAVAGDDDAVLGLRSLTGDERPSQSVVASNFKLQKALIKRCADAAAETAGEHRVAVLTIDLEPYASPAQRVVFDLKAMKKHIRAPLAKLAPDNITGFTTCYVRHEAGATLMVRPRARALIVGGDIDAVLEGRFGTLGERVRPTANCPNPIQIEPVAHDDAALLTAVASLFLPDAHDVEEGAQRCQYDGSDLSFDDALDLATLTMMAMTPIKQILFGQGKLKRQVSDRLREVASVAKTKSAGEEAILRAGAIPQFVAGLPISIDGRRVGLPWVRG